MMYKGTRVFQEQIGTEADPKFKEHHCNIVFDLDDLKRIEVYCYDEFKSFGEKLWVYFNGEDSPVIIVETEEAMIELWAQRRINNKIHTSESYKTLNLVKSNQ